MSILKKIASIFFVSALVFVAGCQGKNRDGMGNGNMGGHTSSVEKEIGDRSYKYFEPASAANKSTPLVLVLHGGLGNADGIERSLAFDPTAEKYGYKVAYLNGTGGRLFSNRRTWNAGYCCGQAQKRGINDVAYIDAVIKDITSHTQVSKIFMIGHSNGGMMTYRYVCERNKNITAMVSLSGTPVVNSCNAAGVKVWHIHGADDQNVPVAGGTGAKGLTGGHMSVAQAESLLTRSGASMKVTVLPNTQHNLDVLQTGARNTLGMPLPEAIGKYFSQF